MLTPAFELTQDGKFLNILIRAPYAKVSETEIFVEENDFKFFSKPYFLRLNLPGNIVENGQEKAEYNAEKGEFSLSFPKQIPGEVFEGLDMITKLLAPKGSKSASQPLIEVIADSPKEVDQKTEGHETECSEDDHVTQDEEFDWTIDQTPFEDPSPLLSGPKYGFANQKSGVFERLQEELCGVVDCPDPDNLLPVQRREARIATEHAKFDADHYLGDFFEDEMIQPLINYVGPWANQIKHVKEGSSVDKEVELTDEEKETMRKLPSKEYLLDIEEETAVYLGLVDILFAYAYNYRVSEGDNNVESGWNISKLSATLSWLEVFSSLYDVVITSYRRCLSYPLYRNWQLCNNIAEDVKHILKLGRRCVLKCLLDVRGSLIDTDSGYILNDLYITDYCVWIQQASETKLKSLSESLEKIKISKDEVGFNLKDLETLAQSAIDDSELDSMTDRVAKLLVQHSGSESSETDSDVTDSDDSRDSDDSDSASLESSDAEEIHNTNCLIEDVKDCHDGGGFKIEILTEDSDVNRLDGQNTTDRDTEKVSNSKDESFKCDMVKVLSEDTDGKRTVGQIINDNDEHDVINNAAASFDDLVVTVLSEDSDIIA